VWPSKVAERKSALVSHASVCLREVTRKTFHEKVKREYIEQGKPKGDGKERGGPILKGKKAA